MIFSPRRSGLSQHATWNVGHSLFSGDKTIKPVQPAQPCPKARLSGPLQPTKPLRFPVPTTTVAPHAKLPSAPPMGGLGLFKQERACVQGHCEGPCSDHRLPANPSALLTLPGAHRAPGRGYGWATKPCSTSSMGKMPRKEMLAEARSALTHEQPPPREHCGRSPARGPVRFWLRLQEDPPCSNRVPPRRQQSRSVPEETGRSCARVRDRGSPEGRCQASSPGPLQATAASPVQLLGSAGRSPVFPRPCGHGPRCRPWPCAVGAGGTQAGP